MSRLGALATAVSKVTQQKPGVITRILSRAITMQEPFEWTSAGEMPPDQGAMLVALRKASAKQLRPVAAAYAAAAADDPPRKRVPGLWLALAEHFEDHESRGDAHRLVASARVGDTKLAYSRAKVRIVR